MLFANTHHHQQKQLCLYKHRPLSPIRSGMRMDLENYRVLCYDNLHDLVIVQNSMIILCSSSNQSGIRAQHSVYKGRVFQGSHTEVLAAATNSFFRHDSFLPNLTCCFKHMGPFYSYFIVPIYSSPKIVYVSQHVVKVLVCNILVQAALNRGV